MANQNYEQKQPQNLSDDARGNKAGQQASATKDNNQSGQKQRQDQQQRPGMTRDEDEE